MARSLTIKFPSPQRMALLAAALILVAAGAFLGVGLGASLLIDPLGAVMAAGDLQKIHVANGNVFLGRIVERGSDELRLRDGAILRQVPESESTAAGVVVQALFADPYSLVGDVVIANDLIVAVGTVDDASSLAEAYREALGIDQPAPQSRRLTAGARW